MDPRLKTCSNVSEDAIFHSGLYSSLYCLICLLLKEKMQSKFLEFKVAKY
jgi:hypothetical protein